MPRFCAAAFFLGLLCIADLISVLQRLTPDPPATFVQVIERILFIYAKLNPGIGYIQGMNEICGPL